MNPQILSKFYVWCYLREGKMAKNNSKILIFSFLFVLCFNRSFAATLVLKSGAIIEGKIVEKTDQYIKINYNDSDLTYLLSDIEKIDESDDNLQNPINKRETLSTGSPNSFSSYLIKGNALRKNMQIDEAIEQYKKALELNTDDKSWVHLFLGQAYIWGDDYGQAIVELNESINLEPQDGFAYSLRGYANMINGDFEKAVSDLNKAINILKNPPEGKDFLFGDKRNFRVKLSEAYIYRGECFFMMNKLTEALNDCNEAIALDSDNPSVY